MNLQELIATFKKLSSTLFLLLFFICLSPAHCANLSDLNLAFYYGVNPPLNKLKLYKNIVLEPSSGVDPKQLQSAQRKIFAYVSLGEALNLNHYAKPIKKDWVLGKNDTWHSLVLDQSNPAWHAFFLNEVITPLWDKGYRGFFLDTLDSYRLGTRTEKEMKQQQKGLITIIQSIKNKYPDAKIIINRGFELLPDIRSLVDEVVAESLFSGWNNQKKQYIAVTDTERNNLLKELNRVKQMNLPITIIDYVAPNHRAEIKNSAKKIANLGFNPWITNGNLTELYLIPEELIARKILVIYQGKLHDIDERIGSYASRALTMPLNHLGYVTVLHNIAESLPQNLSRTEYAGIVVAIDGLLLGRESELYKWYRTQINNKIPMVIFNQFGFSIENSTLHLFGLSTPLFNYFPHSLKIIFQSPMIGYEIKPVFKLESFISVQLKKGTSLLKVADQYGTVSDIAAITPWGGYYLTNTFLAPIVNDNYRWSIDPFKFYKLALKLPDIPIPDTTTENGRRLMFVHIDGDGFANRGEWFKGPFAGEVMEKEFLEPYAIPTTVSIIQGELAPNGLYPQLSEQLEKIARRIFSLSSVEIASHTFSHPFNWRDAAAHDYKKSPINPYTLRIPNYQFNLKTEINGSVEYINTQLAPKDKKCKVFLWPGEGDAPPEALKLTYQLGLANLNPGTLITQSDKSLTQISSLGLFEQEYFQVFAPIGNDRETLANSPIFYTLIKIIDALKLTETPIRFKPIDIYIHFFTVSQKGGIKALHKVYQWALSQKVMNIFASEFFNKIQDFNQLIIAKKNNGWLIETNNALKELRIPHTMGYPDLIQSTNVIGYNSYNKDYYIHLGPNSETYLQLTSTPPSIPFLVDANARVTRFVRTEQGIDLSFEGYTPLKLSFNMKQSCHMWRGKEKITEKSLYNNQKYYEFKEVNNDFSIRCN